MTASDLHPDATTSAREFCADLLLDDEATALLDQPVNPRRLIETLVERKLYPDAYKVIALGLDARDGVEWALACVRRVTKEPSEQDNACIAAAEAWIVDPGDQTREHAKKIGERAGYTTAASWLAVAAGWTGGSVAPPGNPVVPPPPSMLASAIAGAVGLAASSVDENQIEPTQRQFYEQAAVYMDRAPRPAPPPAASGVRR